MISSIFLDGKRITHRSKDQCHTVQMTKRALGWRIGERKRAVSELSILFKWENCFALLFLIWSVLHLSLHPWRRYTCICAILFRLHCIFPPGSGSRLLLFSLWHVTLQANRIFRLAHEACSFLALSALNQSLKKKLVKELITKWSAYSVVQ